MAKKNTSRQKKIDLRVDFTPMVDMMMLLITFFMLCTSLSKPQAILLTMPSNDKNVQEQDKTATKASQTITIFVAGNDKIYYVAGIPNYEDPSCLKETTWGKDGIRSVLINHVTEDGTVPVAAIMKAKLELDAKKLKDPAKYPDSIYNKELEKLKNGEVAGYVRNIVDYKPTDLSFNSSLNSDWYQSGDYLYTSSLANTRLEAGESKDFYQK